MHMPLYMVIRVTMMVSRRVRISTPFRVEGRDDMGDRRAEPPYHVFQDMIFPNAQRGPEQLGRQMTIAQMPGNADQGRNIRGCDLQERLVQGLHIEDGTVIQQEFIAAAQMNRGGEIEQDSFAFLRFQC